MTVDQTCFFVKRAESGTADRDHVCVGFPKEHNSNLMNYRENIPWTLTMPQ